MFGQSWSRIPTLMPALAAALFATAAPSWAKTVHVELTAVETEVVIDGKGTTYAAWTFNAQFPGPVVRVTEATRVPVGVNVLRNDARSALAVAVATGARFIRVNVHTGTMFTDQGAVTGTAHDTLRVREGLGAPVAILADVLVKHAAPPSGSTIEDAARDCWHRGLADGLIVSGPGTGRATDPAELAAVRDAVPEAPLWVGSGVTTRSVGRWADMVDGLIVGSALRAGGVAGAPVEPARVAAFMDAVRAARSA